VGTVRGLIAGQGESAEVREKRSVRSPRRLAPRLLTHRRMLPPEAGNIGDETAVLYLVDPRHGPLLLLLANFLVGLTRVEGLPHAREIACRFSLQASGLCGRL
jgi:hypothetical protein